MVNEKVTAYIGVGSNLGDKVENCIRAINTISNLDGCHLSEQASFYRTEPIGMNGVPWFVNSVTGIETLLEPYDLLKLLLRIEEDMGRRRNKRLDSRIIDLDILFYDKLSISAHDLVIPHPGAHLRRFVLTPLAEIAPNFVHPILHVSVSQLLTKLEDGNPVVEKIMGPECTSTKGII